MSVVIGHPFPTIIPLQYVYDICCEFGYFYLPCSYIHPFFTVHSRKPIIYCIWLRELVLQSKVRRHVSTRSMSQCVICSIRKFVKPRNRCISCLCLSVIPTSTRAANVEHRYHSAVPLRRSVIRNSCSTRIEISQCEQYVPFSFLFFSFWRKSYI